MHACMYSLSCSTHNSSRKPADDRHVSCVSSETSKFCYLPTILVKNGLYGCIDKSIESGLVGKVRQLQCHTVCLSWQRGGRAMKMAGRCTGQWGGIVRLNRRQRSTRVLSSLS